LTSIYFLLVIFDVVAAVTAIDAVAALAGFGSCRRWFVRSSRR